MSPDDTVPDGYWDRLAEVALAWPAVAPEMTDADARLVDALGWR